MSPLRRLIDYMRRLPAMYLAGSLATLAYAALFQVIPLAVRGVVSAIEGGEPIASVERAVVYLVVVSLVFAVVRYASRVLLFNAGRELEYQIRNDFLAHLQRLPQSFFHTTRTGDLMSRAVNDINSIRLFLGMGLLNILQTPVLYVGGLGVMLAMDVRLTLWVLSPFPVFLLVMRYFGRQMFEANLAGQEQLASVSAVVQENASGTMVVRSNALEPQEERRFAEQNDGLYAAMVRVAKVNAAMMAIIGLLPATAMMLVLLRGGAAVTQGRLETADLWVFYMYITLLTFPTIMLGFVLNIVQRGLAAMGRLGAVFDLVPAIRERPDTVAVDSLAGAVELTGLSFTYPDRREPALDGITLSVARGQSVGIVGPIGSGKSTLVSAIPRLLEIEDGMLSIDGVELNRLPLSLLRGSIAMVPQDAFLFSTTITENIRFGRPGASMDEVREAAGRAHVLSDIEEFPDGFDTLVGERGITLSGGQRQRIAIARALLLDPAILILDDALSSVDHNTEEAILETLRTAKAGRTCFIVAHRLSAVRDADQIVVVEGGRIIERGAHAELVKQDGLYARLHRQQQLEDELEENVA